MKRGRETSHWSIKRFLKNVSDIRPLSVKKLVKNFFRGDLYIYKTINN